MKNFFAAMMIAFIVAISTDCSADAIRLRDLDQIVGDWYDLNGNVVLTISSDHKFNGRKILSFRLLSAAEYGKITGVDGDFGDTEVHLFKIEDGTRAQEILIEYWHQMSYNTIIDYHEHLVLNLGRDDEIRLRRTKEQRYFESVGGIYLGMNKNQVAALYGQPSRVENVGGNQNFWQYKREGFEICFLSGVVTRIRLYRNGNRRFDRSGLSPNNSRAEFFHKYNKICKDNSHIDIGYGERIWFYDDSVVLCLEANF